MVTPITGAKVLVIQPTNSEAAAAYVTLAHARGAKVISIGSFAHPKWTPQMACIDEIAQQWQASVHTVARGIRRVYQKLQFDLRANGLSLA